MHVKTFFSTATNNNHPSVRCKHEYTSPGKEYNNIVQQYGQATEATTSSFHIPFKESSNSVLNAHSKTYSNNIILYLGKQYSDLKVIQYKHRYNFTMM